MGGAPRPPYAAPILMGSVNAVQFVRLVHPPHVGVLASDALGWTRPIRASRTHLAATMDWLCRAQDASRGGGVSACYSLLRGWDEPYPETTGYIIPTFFDYAAFSQRPTFGERARRMGEWLLSIQLKNGAFQAGYFHGTPDDANPSVFNSGQILLGLTRLYRETADQRYLTSACRVGDWILSMQSPDGAWRGGLSFHGPTTPVRTYYARVGWALMELGAIADDMRYFDAGRRHGAWVVAQQQDNGWFRNNEFWAGHPPFTHTIAYVMEGLLGIAAHSRQQEPVNAVLKTATKLLHLFETRGNLAGDYDQDWKSKARYRCMTGEAQVSGVWLQIYRLTGDIRFLNASMKLNDRLKSSQHLGSHFNAIRGGVKGSQPLWGKYHRLAYVNWGGKFLADTLMAEIGALAKFGGEVDA